MFLGCINYCRQWIPDCFYYDKTSWENVERDKREINIEMSECTCTRLKVGSKGCLIKLNHFLIFPRIGQNNQMPWVNLLLFSEFANKIFSGIRINFITRTEGDQSAVLDI